MFLNTRTNPLQGRNSNSVNFRVSQDVVAATTIPVIPGSKAINIKDSILVGMNVKEQAFDETSMTLDEKTNTYSVIPVFNANYNLAQVFTMPSTLDTFECKLPGLIRYRLMCRYSWTYADDEIRINHRVVVKTKKNDTVIDTFVAGIDGNNLIDIIGMAKITTGDKIQFSIDTGRRNAITLLPYASIDFDYIVI